SACPSLRLSPSASRRDVGGRQLALAAPPVPFTDEPFSSRVEVMDMPTAPGDLPAQADHGGARNAQDAHDLTPRCFHECFHVRVGSQGLCVVGRWCPDLAGLADTP